MNEISYRLPEVVYIEMESQKRALEIGRIAIAGFVDWEDYTDIENPESWPYPLFTVDGIEAASRKEPPAGGELLSYWNLRGNLMTNTPSRLSRVRIPEDSDSPYVYVSNVGWPPRAYTVLFETPIPYHQATFEEAVKNNWSDEDFRDFYGYGIDDR